MDKHIQNQTGGDNSHNIQAGGNVLYCDFSKSDQKDFGIIDEIFKNVIKDLQSSDRQTNREHVDLLNKIEINFKSDEDRVRVKNYFKYALTKISLIEKRIQEENTEIQNDLNGHVFQRYNALKDQGLSNIDILEQLFSQFIIPEKNDNPEYCSLTRAFILFFFDDCTIFEKTDAEK